MGIGQRHIAAVIIHIDRHAFLLVNEPIHSISGAANQ